MTGKKAGTATVTLSAPGHQEATVKITVARLAKPSFAKKYWSTFPNEKTVYKALMRMKKQYPNGTRWNDYDFYELRKPINTVEGEIIGGYACNGFAYMLFDAAFGSLPVRCTWFPTDFRVGDILQLEPYHKAIVIKVDKKKVTLAEGNYGGKVKWGRTLTRAQLKNRCVFSISRYPVKVVPLPPPVVK